MLTTRRPSSRSILALAAVAATCAMPTTTQAQIQIRPPVRVEPIQVPAGVVTQGPVVINGNANGQPVNGIATVTAPSTIGSHQIDKFEAIRQVQADLKSDANNVINWTILGELAHEVALDLPEGQDDAYYKMSRDAYEHAAQLEPANNGLRAALQFAREQEAGAAAFDARRRQGVSTYLDARRREMTATGINPTVMVYESPTTTVTNPINATPGTVTTTTTPITTYGTGYPTATYRPYYNNQVGQPYSYNQYSNGYVPPDDDQHPAQRLARRADDPPSVRSAIARRPAQQRR